MGLGFCVEHRTGCLDPYYTGLHSLKTCTHCHGFNHVSSTICIHCDTRLTTASNSQIKRIGKLLLVTASTASLSMTLAACYGSPCAHSQCDRTYNDVNHFSIQKEKTRERIREKLRKEMREEARKEAKDSDKQERKDHDEQETRHHDKK